MYLVPLKKYTLKDYSKEYILISINLETNAAVLYESSTQTKHQKTIDWCKNNLYKINEFAGN